MIPVSIIGVSSGGGTGSAGVRSINGRGGDVSLNKNDVGLGGVTNDAQLVKAQNLADIPSRGAALKNIGSGRAFDTVEDAQAAEFLHDGEVVCLKGHNAAQDGGGGSFHYVLGDETPADGGLVFAVPGGRLHRVRSDKLINVQHFGARGDGVTDDTAAIRAALAAASAEIGCPPSLYFPKGIYLVSETVAVDFSGLRIVGDGWDSSIIRGSADGMGSVFTVYNDSERLFNVRFYHVRVDAKSAVTVDPDGIVFRNCSECSVFECKIGTGLANGIRVDGCEIIYLGHSTFTGNDVGVYQTRQTPGSFGYANVWAHMLNFYESTTCHVKTDSAVGHSGYRDCWFEATPIGILFTNRDGTDAEVDNFHIDGCHFQVLPDTPYVGGKFISAQAGAGSNYFVMLNLAVRDCKVICTGSERAIEFLTAGNTNPGTAFFNIDIQSVGIHGPVSVSGVYSDTAQLSGRVAGSVFVLGGAPITSGLGNWYSELNPPGGVVNISRDTKISERLWVGCTGGEALVNLAGDSWINWRNVADDANVTGIHAHPDGSLDMYVAGLTRWTFGADGTFKSNGAATIGTIGGGDLTLTGSYVTLTPEARVSGNGGVLKVVGTDNCYTELYPAGIAGGRKGYFGFASAGTHNLSIVNEDTAGYMLFNTGGATRVFIYETGNIEITENLTVDKTLRCTTFIQAPSAPPAAAGSNGVAGQFAWDADYVYVCVAANTWKRAAIATW